MSLHIAVLLPAPFNGGVIRSAVNVSRMLARGGRVSGDNPRITLGMPEDMNTSQVPFEKLAAEGVSVRTYRLDSVDARKLEPHYRFFLDHKKDAARAESYVVFNDGMSNFEDADLWIVMSDHFPGLLPPHRRYGVFCYDFVNRYYPDIWTDENWKTSVKRVQAIQSADFVITSTQRMKRDVVAYLGFEPSRILTVPVEIDPSEFEAFETIVPGRPASEAKAADRPRQILWPTILSQHENHERMFDGLERFFHSHADTVIQVVGYGTDELDPASTNQRLHPYILGLRKRVSRSDALSANMRFNGFVSDAQYGALLQNSDLLLHSSRYDNGSYSIIEAAWYGLPAVSTEYDAMKEIAQQCGIPLTYYDINVPESVSDAIAQSLATLDARRAALPSRDSLQRLTYENLAPDYWKLVSEFVTRIVK